MYQDKSPIELIAAYEALLEELQRRNALLPTYAFWSVKVLNGLRHAYIKGRFK
jgi:hypothetical protein